MSHNRALHKQLRSARAHFYPADLHFHSPASADNRRPPRFDQLSQEIQDKLSTIPEATATNPVQYEKQVMKAFPPESFYKSLIERRDTVIAGTEAEDGDDWAIVAITDHNVCKYACEVASHAWSKLSSHRLVVMPGIELTVNYPVPPDGTQATAHLVCFYSPNTTDSDIRIAICDSMNPVWDFGQPLDLDSLPDFVKNLRSHSNYPAVCIAAHVGSSEGVQNETRKAILSRLDAAISRIRGEISSGNDIDENELRERLEQLENNRDDRDQIALEILDLIGQCGFDALQVRGRIDEIHYRRLHRFREQNGRAVPIVCSDAHRVEDLFVTPDGIPYLKLSGLSASSNPQQIFETIKQALRLGETRYTCFSHDAPSYWISGLEISKDSAEASSFWPFTLDSNGKHIPFVLPLSRNLNCLIGGRGSGKSAALEAMAFVTHETDFVGFHQKREEEIDDYYKRAKATLEGCNVNLCLQFLEYDEIKDIPKKSVFASRYFDPGGHHLPVTYSTIDDTELLSGQVPEHTIQYYRLGEIEKQTGAEHLRLLFDRICGHQIQEHEKLIKSLTKQLENQRIEMVSLSEEISKLTEEDSPLRRYIKRKRLFDEVNTDDIKDAYEEVDRTSAAVSTTDSAIEDWTSIQQEYPLDTLSEDVKEFFDELGTVSSDEDNQTKPYHDKLAELSLSSPSDSEETPRPRKRIDDAAKSLTSELTTVATSLTDIKAKIAISDQQARNTLAERGLPTGSKDREAKKAAFEEAEEYLAQYREFVSKWDTLNKERKDLVSLLQEECDKRTKLRSDTAIHITTQLKRDIDPSVLVIEADAQDQMDRRHFVEWLNDHFAAQEFKHKMKRTAVLIKNGLTPQMLRSLLLDEGEYDWMILKINMGTAEKGDISESVAKGIVERCIGRYRLECEINQSDVGSELWNSLPHEIRDGLLTFPFSKKVSQSLRVDEVLSLDEIIFDDIPVIRSNDRPLDERSKPRRIEELSPGQRCSAILPILLLTGLSPLVIDQPEDNMDNRLIRQVIVNILSSIKLRRQVIVATHNPNLPVLGDVEQAIILQGIGERECEVKALGDLDSDTVVYQLTEVMEGGREAFQYRQSIYQVHWPGHVISIPTAL